MNETNVKEAAAVYEVTRPSSESMALPPEFIWLRWLTPDEQGAFFQALMEALARAWRSLSIVPLNREIERWQRQAQERMAARTEAERQALWTGHERRLDRQRTLIDDLLQETAGGAETVPSTPEIRELLGRCIPYRDSLSDEIMAMRYEE